jgi:hypothetical protein
MSFQGFRHPNSAKSDSKLRSKSRFYWELIVLWLVGALVLLPFLIAMARGAEK